MQVLSPISKMLQTLSHHCETLQKLQTEVLQIHHIDDHPIRNLLAFYQKQLMPRLQQRSRRSTIFNDIMIWELPKLLSQLYRVDVFVQSVDEQTKNILLDAHVGLDLPENSRVGYALGIPHRFMENEMIQCVRECSEEAVREGRNTEGEGLLAFMRLFCRLITEENNMSVGLPVEEFEAKINGLIFPPFTDGHSRITVKYAYRFLFIARLKIRVRKANKRINQRRMRIQQLIQGQKKYVNGLTEYIDYIKNPICRLQILNDIETKKLFSTIESIVAFHRMFSEQLSKRFQGYHKYQTYGDLITRNIPFFKIYTDYIEYADEAQTLLLKLQDQNPDVRAICHKFMQEKQKKASDELKQPTFRIARYSMIISEILKNTSNCHPDYPLLKQALKQAGTNLSKINETVDVIAKRTRLYQLDQQFGTEERPIINEKRNFLEEYHLRLIKQDKLQSVYMFIFTDLVIVTDQSRKILQWINVDESFYVRREEDNKTYRNMIKIHSDGFLTFSAGKEDRHFAKAQRIYETLKNLAKANIDTEKMVYVHVIGTEEKNTSTFNKYTEYIAEIKFMGMRKFTRLRFSLMKAFVAKIQQFYKNDLGISLDEGLKDSWLYNYTSKTIEDRKRSIEQILQKMLNHSLVRSDPSFILNQLGIQPSFLRNTHTLVIKRNNTVSQSTSQISSPLIFKRQGSRQIRQAETLMCATEIKMGRDSYHDLEAVGRKVVDSERVDIEIYTMVGDEPLMVKISDLYTVEDVCYEVSNILDLKTNRDFRLFHEVGKRELRVLDHDQKLTKLFTFPKKSTGGSSIFGLITSLKNIIVPEANPRLIFKKYYHLPVEIEQSQCKKDTTRLRLIVYQIFNQIKNMKYTLNFEQYLLFLAIIIYIEYDGQVPDQTDTCYVSKIIPHKIFKMKNQTQQFWLNQCRSHLLWLKQQINNIIAHNLQKVKSKRIQHDSPIHFGHRHICSMLAIAKIKANPIYGSNLFYIQLTKDTYDKLAKAGKNVAFNMWLAVKLDIFMLMTPSTNEVVLEAKMEEIDRIVVETEGLIFKMESMMATCEYSFNTYQPFEISELIKYNKAMAEAIVELDNNEGLMSKTRQYKKQLQQYRNSYDKAQRQTMENPPELPQRQSIHL